MQAASLQVFKASSSKGEGLKTLKSINSGTRFHSSVFDVVTLCEESLRFHCSRCLKKASDLKCCTMCGMMNYCSNECVEADRRYHSMECLLASRLKPMLPTRSQRLLLRLLASEKEKEVTCDVSLTNLESYDGDLIKYYMSGIAIILKYIPESMIRATPQELILKSCQLKCSSFSICHHHHDEEESSEIGLGYSQLLGKLNHSCRPNCEVEYGATRAFSLLALEDISPGQELTISYFSSGDADGLEFLKRHYYFTCDCGFCGK